MYYNFYLLFTYCFSLPLGPTLSFSTTPSRTAVSNSGFFLKISKICSAVKVGMVVPAVGREGVVAAAEELWSCGEEDVCCRVGVYMQVGV